MYSFCCLCNLGFIVNFYTMSCPKQELHLYAVTFCRLLVHVAIAGTSSTGTSNGVVLEEVLEEPPKWKVLRVSK